LRWLEAGAYLETLPMRVPLVCKVDEILLPYNATSLRFRDSRKGILEYWKQVESRTIFLTDSDTKVGTLARIERLQAQDSDDAYIGSVIGLAPGELLRRYVHDDYRIEFAEVRSHAALTADDRLACRDFARWLDPVLLQIPEGLVDMGLSALRIRAESADDVHIFYRVASLFLQDPSQRRDFLRLNDVGEQVGFVLQVIRRAFLTGARSGWTSRSVGAARTH
jgi:hypothetical protein